MAESAFWLSLAMLAYVYAGYPFILYLAGASRPVKSFQDPVEWPVITLVISAYNEQAVIADKLENALALDYPQDRLNVLVVSDASDDRTDEIVAGYATRGVQLLRMSEREGKTAGLNAAVEAARGEVIVFSDANALYTESALKHLARPFLDPEVGAVVGESTYNDSDDNAGQSEGLYWRYETWIKRMESRTGSVVGGDGAIYAIRRGLYEAMPADALSDFVNPLQVVRRGFRCVYEPRARSVEKAAGDFHKEFRRKVRIVNRAWRATMKMKEMLNPFAHGWFAVKLISHKLLRWLVPVFLLLLFAASLLLWSESRFYQLILAGQGAFYILAALGWAQQGRKSSPAILYVPYYFCLVNVASVLGIHHAYRGITYTTWATPRVETS